MITSHSPITGKARPGSLIIRIGFFLPSFLYKWAFLIQVFHPHFKFGSAAALSKNWHIDYAKIEAGCEC
jgi:hypothetical protein